MAKKLVLPLGLAFFALAVLFLALQPPIVGATTQETATADAATAIAAPTATPEPTATPISGLLPAFGISWEKYDPSDGSNTTTFQGQYDRPYSITVLSYNPPPDTPSYIGFNGDIPIELFWITNFKGWRWMVFDPQWSNPETLPPNYTPSHEVFGMYDQENQWGDNIDWCQPQGQPYKGPTFTAVLTDTAVGPALVYENDTAITITQVGWAERHGSGADTIWIDYNIQPGQVITGPTNLWWGQMNGMCWGAEWDFTRWKPAPLPTATPTAMPTLELPTATPTTSPTPIATPTNTPMPQPPAAPSISFVTPAQSNLGVFWNDNASNESGYYVFYSLNGSQWTTAGELPPNSSSLIVEGLICGTNYQILVQAWNTAGSANASGQYSTLGCNNPTPTPTPAPWGGTYKLYLPLVVRAP